MKHKSYVTVDGDVYGPIEDESLPGDDEDTAEKRHNNHVKDFVATNFPTQTWEAWTTERILDK